MQAALGKKELQLLGKLLIRDHPEIASNLYAVHCQPQPTETDLSKIPALFHKFCKIKGISPDECTPDTYCPGKCTGKHFRLLFVAVALHLYKPEIFNQPTGSFVIFGGFCITLTRLFNYQSRSKVSEIVREAVSWEKHYDDFRAEVERITELLKEK